MLENIKRRNQEENDDKDVKKYLKSQGNTINCRWNRTIQKGLKGVEKWNLSHSWQLEITLSRLAVDYAIKRNIILRKLTIDSGTFEYVVEKLAEIRKLF